VVGILKGNIKYNMKHLESLRAGERGIKWNAVLRCFVRQGNSVSYTDSNVVCIGGENCDFYRRDYFD